MPPNLEIGETLADYPIEPFDLTPQESFERDLSALPKGRITGTVRGPDSKPFEGYVNLYSLDQFISGGHGIDSFQGVPRLSEPWQPFQFDHLAPGDYIVVVGGPMERRTFYPDARDLDHATVIHLADGQQITGADIQLGRSDSPR